MTKCDCPRNMNPSYSCPHFPKKSTSDAKDQEIERLKKLCCIAFRCSVRQEFELGNHDSSCPLYSSYVPTWLRPQKESIEILVNFTEGEPLKPLPFPEYD